MVEKGNIQVFPEQYILKCGKIEVISDGLSQHTEVYIDGKKAHGIYDLKMTFNTKRPVRCELGVFLRQFDFQIIPKDQKGKE